MCVSSEELMELPPALLYQLAQPIVPVFLTLAAVGF